MTAAQLNLAATGRRSGWRRFSTSLDGMLAMIGATILLVSLVVFTAQGTTVEKTDFTVTYVGAWMIHQGQGASLYDLAEQAKVKKILFTKAEPLIFEHPPFEAWLLSPLAVLPYRTAYLVWGLFNVVVWLTIPQLLRPWVRNQNMCH